jgi:hypothetical protein
VRSPTGIIYDIEWIAEFERRNMRRFLILVFAVLPLSAKVEPKAGQWKTWVISSGSAMRLPAPPASDVEFDVTQGLALGTSVGQKVAARAQTDGAN